MRCVGNIPIARALEDKTRVGMKDRRSFLATQESGQLRIDSSQNPSMHYKSFVSCLFELIEWDGWMEGRGGVQTIFEHVDEMLRVVGETQEKVDLTVWW